MITTPSVENTRLFINYLEVCNAALAASRETFPYKQIVALSEKALGDKSVTADIYEDDPDRTVGSVAIRFVGGRIEPVSGGGQDSAFRVKFKRDYMAQVVRHRGEYIQHPEKLDWDWLKSRLGIGDNAGLQSLVSEVMSHPVHSVDHGATLRQAAALMRDLDVGALPVTDGHTVVGFLTDRDIAIRAVAQGLDPNTTRAGKMMTPGVVSCRDDARIADAARAMEGLKVRRILVLGRDDKPVGFVSLGDLAVRAADDHMLGRVVTGVSTPAAPVH